VSFQFAELNIARLRQPLDHADSAEFVAVLDAVNRIAEVTAGFVWRLQDEEGRSSSYVSVFDDPLLIVNLSVWETPDHLKHYVYRSGHGAYFRRRAEWFDPHAAVDMVCWWIPQGTVPSLEDAVGRLDHLRTHGSSDYAFGFTDLREAPA
jgi:hypothetical protein